MRKIIRAILIIVGTLLLFLFVAPLYCRIINIGNIIGIIFSCVMIIVGLFFNGFIRLTDKIKSKKTGKLLYNTCFGGVIVVLLCFCIALCSVFSYSSTNADNQDTVIILGCAVKGNVPSLMLSQRINAAYRYLDENPDSVAVLSGGRGPGENISEAQCMYNVLTDKGIDSSRLYLEDKSTNTLENITFSKEIIKNNNLSENIAIASSDFHLKRATMVAKKQGITAKRIVSQTSFFLKPTYYVRDTLGIILEFLLR